MNRAYELESCFAKSPRVIIDPDYNEVLKQSQNNMPEHWPYTFCIDDGLHEIDFLTGAAMSPSASCMIERKITHWINIYSNDARILEKYIALQKRWELAKALAKEKLKMRKNT